MRPTFFQPEPGSESWKNRIRQWRLSPQTDPKQPGPCQANQQTLQHKHWAPGSGSARRGHFSEVTSALKVLCFLPAQPREQSPQSPRAWRGRHQLQSKQHIPGPGHLSNPTARTACPTACSPRTQPCLPGQMPEERSPRSQTRLGVFAHAVPFSTYSAL